MEEGVCVCVCVSERERERDREIRFILDIIPILWMWVCFDKDLCFKVLCVPVCMRERESRTRLHSSHRAFPFNLKRHLLCGQSSRGTDYIHL
ncbi:hypothetical protein BT93_A1828 [Corymbia citriodora subsp. variegata]|nr:hypothetical protein BT93_A1828 [Corymbia citriodora subsp. variegata]